MATRDNYYLRVRYGTFRIPAVAGLDQCDIGNQCADCGDETPATSDHGDCPPRWFIEALLEYVYANADNPLVSLTLLTLATYGPPCLVATNDDCDIANCLLSASIDLYNLIQDLWDEYQSSGTIGEDPDEQTIPTLMVQKGTFRLCGTLVSTRCDDISLCSSVCDSDSG